MALSRNAIALDFETYSPTDLRTRGLRNYLDDPDFTPLIAATTNGHDSQVFDFVQDPKARDRFDLLMHRVDKIYAHNAEFEYQVLLRMGIRLSPEIFFDTATMSRCYGLSGSLDGAGRQLLTTHKATAAGSRLIRKFCMPGEFQELQGDMSFSPLVMLKDPTDDWAAFQEYCLQDTKVCWDLAINLPQVVDEAQLNGPTYEMNRVGWPVDLDLVREMQSRYQENLTRIVREFRDRIQDDPLKPLNLNSHAQLKAWCQERGVKATSFDKEAIAALLPRVRKKMASIGYADPKWQGYYQVRLLLETKRELGGSSLKKLQTILDTVSSNGRLHNQYIHVGAAQSWRTTGVGVQMQNLKRIGAEAEDVDVLSNEDIHWDNDKLARSLRQCFTSSHPQGQLIVGDFSSVESRALAYLAEEGWKLGAYRKGQDLYKVQASQIYNIPYDQVTKEQRQTGKLGELSCGYGAGRKAVTKFAKNMGVEMSEDEAADLVTAWRDANPKTVQLWDTLETAVRAGLSNYTSAILGSGVMLTVQGCVTPQWISDRTKNRAQSVMLNLTWPGGTMNRIFHGVHLRGNDIVYYKPSSGKTGDPWVNHYRDPVTKEVIFYTLYGGKLAGIVTQSLCREVFMYSLNRLYMSLIGVTNVDVIGQFHDEIVLDWRPTAPGKSGSRLTLDTTKDLLASAMTYTTLKGFPLEADIKNDYRYTK